jgi:hypothetical protein
MPTVLRDGPYRLFFYSSDASEPPHVHIERDDKKAKFWLDPVRLEDNEGFGSTELNRVSKLVVENVDGLLRSWNEFFEPQNADGEGAQSDSD